MNKQDQIYPVDVFVYNHIKFFTEKGDGCCFQSNEKIASEIGRHKTNVSRSISKLIRLGYVKSENDNGRKLKTIADLCVKNCDNLAKGSDKIAMLVDILAMPCDKNAMDRVIKSLRGSDNLAKHNIEYKLRYLNDNYFKNETREETLNQYGEFKNVCLEETYYNKLIQQFGLDKTTYGIERLDTWLDDPSRAQKRNRNHRSYFKKNSWVWERYEEPKQENTFNGVYYPESIMELDGYYYDYKLNKKVKPMSDGVPDWSLYNAETGEFMRERANGDER